MSEANLQELIELIPIALIGLLIGLVSYFTDKERADDKEDSFNENPLITALKQVLFSLTICVIVYSILTATNLPYLAKIGVSSAVSFFGVDKAISILKDLIALRSGRDDKK